MHMWGVKTVAERSAHTYTAAQRFETLTLAARASGPERGYVVVLHHKTFDVVMILPRQA